VLVALKTFGEDFFFCFRWKKRQISKVLDQSLEILLETDALVHTYNQVEKLFHSEGQCFYRNLLLTNAPRRHRPIRKY
jgi:hypothetical protein